jgi:hypothetical protein
MTFVSNQARIIACDLEVPLNQLCIYENNLVARPSTCAEGRFFCFQVHTHATLPVLCRPSRY